MGEIARPALASLVAAVSLACALPGCGEKKAPPAPESAAPPPTVAPAAAAAKPLPPGRSPVPSLAEYAAAREVTVKGSSALRCETKMIREWLRVTCRGGDAGPTPTGVDVVRGGRGETIVFAAGGVTSVITPVLEGTDFEARFSWTDASHALTVRWPRGTPRPVVVGEFAGAASPLDRTAPSAAICACYQRLAHAADCADAPFAQPDCEHTYPTDCDKLIACARGEPGAPPTCPAGKRNAGVTGWCAPTCGPGRPACAAGTECSSDWGQPPVCL